MADIRIQGADKLAEVAKALKQAGNKELRKELYAAINRSTKDLRNDAKESARQHLPRSGGLNKRVAKARMSTKRRTGRVAGVKIVAVGMDQLALMDRGRVKHPVHGHRDRWVEQRIPEAEGWFTEPMQAGAPKVRKELVQALDDLAKKIERKL